MKSRSCIEIGVLMFNYPVNLAQEEFQCAENIDI